MKNSVMGIDPGLSGGLALYLPDSGSVSAVRMPVLEYRKKRTIDLSGFISCLNLYDPARVVIEYQQSMPGQGVSSSFRIGYHYGILIGLLHATGYPVTEVTPVKWKREMGVPRDKDAARHRASQEFPAASHLWALKRDDGLAEAALLAKWGAVHGR